MTPEYRTYQPEDFPQVYSIEQRAFEHPQTEGQLKALLMHPSICWVAIRDDSVIGFVIARAVLDESELLNIAISPEYHGGEIAQRLFDCFLNTLKVNGVCSVFLEVRGSSQRAIGFYRRNNFQVCGTRADYYPQKSGHKKEDAVLMRLEVDCS